MLLRLFGGGTATSVPRVAIPTVFAERSTIRLKCSGVLVVYLCGRAANGYCSAQNSTGSGVLDVSAFLLINMVLRSRWLVPLSGGVCSGPLLCAEHRSEGRSFPKLRIVIRFVALISYHMDAFVLMETFINPLRLCGRGVVPSCPNTPRRYEVMWSRND